MNPRQTVLPGQRLRVAAAQVNWINEQMGPRPGMSADPAGGLEPARNVILARNDTGSNVDRWGILRIDGVVISPNSGDRQRRTFEDQPCVVGSVPDPKKPAWCVAVEPIKAGRIGRVAVGGVVQCKLTVTSSSDRFATCGSTTSSLVTGSSGEALILWKGSGWGLVRLGCTRGIVRGTWTGSWSKGTTKSVTDALSGATITVKNYFSSLTATSAKQCAAAWVGEEWILIAAEC